MKEYFKIGQTVLFQGDSVTDCGREYGTPCLGTGYPKKIADVYSSFFDENGVNFVNRGVSGNRIKDILARYDEDILAVKPDFISILIGINDVWRRYDSEDPTTAEAFEKDYESLLKKIKSDFPNTKIMLIEPFVLHSLEDREGWHEDLDPKIQAVRKLAAEYADYYLPMDGIFAAAAACTYSPAELAEDGVHPSSLGHSLITTEYLRALGVIA